jgi:hypothetical protein
MNDNVADLVFPPRAIPALRSLRGSDWQKLVDSVTNLDHLEEDRLAFVLMMVHLGGCMTCQADSFKAMRGCTQCSMLTIKRFRGTDRELLDKFIESKNELDKYSEEV